MGSRPWWWSTANLPHQRRIDVAKAQDRFEVRSTKASDVSRQLALTGVAIAWVFSGSTKLLNPGIEIPSGFLAAGLLFVVGLACDFFQYVVASATWGIYSRIKELQVMAGRETEPFVSPRWLNWGAILFFVLKISVLLAGYVVLGVAFADRITSSAGS
jgi:hypothetical protein